MEEAEKIFREMKEKEEKEGLVVVDERAYGVLVDWYCRAGKMEMLLGFGMRCWR